LNPLSRQALAPLSEHDAVAQQLGAALRSRGYAVDVNVGQSKFRCDLAVRKQSDSIYQLGILVDTDGHYANRDLLDAYLFRPSILRAFGWSCAFVLTKDWYHSPDDVLARLQKILDGKNEDPSVDDLSDEEIPATMPVASGVEPAGPTAPASSIDGRRSDDEHVASARVIPEGVAPSGNSARRFEVVSGSSRKFWEITFSGCSFTVRFGRIGTTGQIQTKRFSDEAKAKQAAEDLIAQKLKKGYAEQR
jgi:predicted DNA-binding WGR domain protein